MADIKNIDYKRCREVVVTLNDYFKDKTHIAEVEYPKEIEFGSNEYFIYMFYSCLLDYGMRSKIYHNNLINTYKSHSEIFNPENVSSMSEENLKETIINHIHPRYPNVAVKKWINLSLDLLKYNNILDYLKSINSYNDLEQFIKSINGYGQKTGGLLLRIIYDSKICDFKEIDSIPIDRHDIEISYLVGIIDSKDLSSKDINNLSDVYVSVCRELGISPSNIDKYLWEVGNSFCNKKDCVNCPLSGYCSKLI